jgi:sugar lactone lactonase YvrE
LYAIAVGADGVIYVAEKTRVRKLTPQANGSYAVSAFAGQTVEGNEDGGGGTAKFHTIRDLVIDASGTVFAADAGNHKLRRLTPVAGAGASVSTVAVPAGVTLSSPSGLTWDAERRLLVGDQGAVRRFDFSTGATPTVTTLAGAGGTGFVDGTGTAARFNGVAGLAVAPDGAVWVADVTNHRLRRLAETEGAWRVETRVGDGTAGNMNGPAEGVAPLGRPTGVAVTADGTIVLADAVSNKILAIDPDGRAVRTLAGTGATGRADGPAATATFNAPDSICVAPDGSLVVAEALNGSLRRLQFDPEGAVTVSTITTALQYPGAVTYGPDGAIYVTEAGHPSFSFLGSHRIRKITLAADGTPTLTALAGGSSGFADGAGTAARFNRPTGIAVASDGVIYVADAENHRLRKLVVDAAGQVTVSTVAGTGTKGKGGATVETVLFDRPTGLALDAAGRLVVTDYWNHRILALSLTDRSVTTLAGLTGDGYSDGPIAQARFSRPVALAFDKAGAILVVDAHPYGVRKVSP